jgi:hypothetical protein
MSETTTAKATETPERKSMFRATALTVKQMDIVNSFIKFNGGNPKMNLTKLMEANLALRGKIYTPYFIYRNDACRKGKSEFDLSKLHVSKESAKKAAEKATAEAEGETAPPKTSKKSNKKSNKKTSTTGKGKSKTTKKPAKKVPVEVPTESVEVPTETSAVLELTAPEVPPTE